MPTITKRQALPIRVLVVDDHMSVSGSVGIAIDQQQDMEFSGTATTVADALQRAGEMQPDVVLMDVHLPDGDGIEAIARLKALAPDARIVVLTAHVDIEVMARAASQGAAGFIAKTRPLVELLGAVRTASEGGMVVERATLNDVVGLIREQERSGAVRGDDPGLTAPELEVLLLLGQGLDVQAIARSLRASITTVRAREKKIMAKLEVRSQLEAVVTAVRRGIIPAL